MRDKKTVIIGASTNPSRYAYLAAERLHNNQIPFVLIGIKKGLVFGQEIQDIRARPHIEQVHTVTLYLSPANQTDWLEYILSLKPQRIVFNPGTENQQFIAMAEAQNIECLQACTLVMIGAGNY